MDQIRQKHNELTKLIEKINQQTQQFKNMDFFLTPSLIVSFNSLEVCFKDYVLYLYSLFVELPGINLKFTDKKIEDFKLKKSGSKIVRLVQDLRTVRGHYTSEVKPKDLAKRNSCEDWYQEVAQTKNPATEMDYGNCTNALLDGTLDYLNSISSCIAHFFTVEYPDIIKEAWSREVDRNYSKYDWELQVTEVLETYGMNHYEPYEITEKQHSKWSGQLRLLKDGFIFNVEAKRIIERYLAEQDIWPASAEDLHALGIPKGREMGEMVKKAKKLYYDNPCPKEELLKRFKKTYMKSE